MTGWSGIGLDSSLFTSHIPERGLLILLSFFTFSRLADGILVLSGAEVFAVLRHSSLFTIHFSLFTFHFSFIFASRSVSARVLKLVDRHVWGACVQLDVRVRVPPRALLKWKMKSEKWKVKRIKACDNHKPLFFEEPVSWQSFLIPYSIFGIRYSA